MNCKPIKFENGGGNESISRKPKPPPNAEKPADSNSAGFSFSRSFASVYALRGFNLNLTIT